MVAAEAAPPNATVATSAVAATAAAASTDRTGRKARAVAQEWWVVRARATARPPSWPCCVNMNPRFRNEQAAGRPAPPVVGHPPTGALEQRLLRFPGALLRFPAGAARRGVMATGPAPLGDA